MSLTPEHEAEIRSKVNPIYRDQRGTESHERAMLLSEIDRLRAEVAKMQAEHEDIEKLRTIATLIKELAKGSDWNNGAHAKFYRHQLLAALAKDSSHE